MAKKSTEEKPQKTEAKPKKLSQEEFEGRVLELAKKGLTSEKIGETLRQEGAHPGEYNKKISRILKDKNVYENPDLKNVENKLQNIDNHIGKNKQDKRAIREKSRIFSQLRRMKKYHGIQVK